MSTATMRFLFALFVITGVLAAMPLQQAPSLPPPSGRYAVARTAIYWTDRTRPEVLTDAADDYRELTAIIWYPTGSSLKNYAPYLPETDRLSSSKGGTALANVFGPIWTAIRSGMLQSHSLEKASVVTDSGLLPVLVFSPGGGTIPIAYTTQMEELASHGYVIVGIHHTYDAPAVAMPDGRVISPAADFWMRLRNQFPDAFEEKVTELLAPDIVTTLNELQRLHKDPASMFASRLDMSRIGVFGHSRGGRIAARACQLDARFKACLSQDGNIYWQPFFLDEKGQSLQQPFMMLDHFDPELTDEILGQMGTTREQYEQNRSTRRIQAIEKHYKTIAGGSYHVTIATPGISHNSFLDSRLLGRTDSDQMNIWPKDVQANTPHLQILRTVTAFTRAFFDKSLSGTAAALLDSPNSLPDVEIRRWNR